MTFITNAIVLSYANQGEADRVYHLFTQKFGKMSVLAKGSQKILSKLGPHLEPPVISKVMVARGKVVDKLIGAEIRKSFPNLRQDFHKREILFFCFKIVSLSTRPEGADEGVYKFLEDFMEFLEKDVSKSDLPGRSDFDTILEKTRISIIISFLLHFFSLIGFYPDFDKNKASVEAVENWVSGILEKNIHIC